MMKKFLIFIFTIFGLMVGMLALMAIEYQISYNKWINSRSGSQLTKPVQKYSSSTDGNKDDFESSKQEYASSSDRKNKDDLESLMNMFKKRVYPLPLLDAEYTSAYATAKEFLKKSPLSMQQIKNDLTKNDRYSEDASLYAIDKLNIDWREQAVLAAKSLQKYRYSKEKLVEQLINVALFTQKEADYAVEHVNFDWKENAVKEAESYVNSGKISKEKLLEILVENKKFTQEEAEYAIEHAKIDLLD